MFDSIVNLFTIYKGIVHLCHSIFIFLDVITQSLFEMNKKNEYLQMNNIK